MMYQNKIKQPQEEHILKTEAQAKATRFLANAAQYNNLPQLIRESNLQEIKSIEQILEASYNNRSIIRTHPNTGTLIYRGGIRIPDYTEREIILVEPRVGFECEPTNKGLIIRNCLNSTTISAQFFENVKEQYFLY